MIDYEARMRESKLLIDQGLYTQAVTTLGNVLENLYTDLYQQMLAAMPPRDRKAMTEKEHEFTGKSDKSARDKGFAGLTLGGKAKFYHEQRVVEAAEGALGLDLKHFRSFDPRAFNAIRIDSTHGADVVVTEDEASLFYSQLRVLLLETGLLKRAEPKVEVVEAGGLRSWKENGVIPHSDIVSGNLEMSTYAADLSGVTRQDPNTPEVYRDARKFFEQTYLTRGMESLLADVLRVLGGGPGDRVLQLRTPFGGGKTHSLIALYHITRNRSRLAANAQLASLPDIGDCAVAAVQCEKFGVLTGRDTPEGIHVNTLWGEIAYQLGEAAGYEYFRAYDESYTSPSGDDIRALIHDVGKPVLILLDEVLNHVEQAKAVPVHDSTLGRQLMTFLKNLTEEVKDTKNAALVYSLQASISEGLGAESLLADLDKLVSRVDAKREPVTSKEVVCVVQRRLFSELGDEATLRQVAAAYAEACRRMWQAAGVSPDEQQRLAQDANRLAERIMESYPLHPDLLDMMYHRWGTLPSYQRTRGALQFLACVIFDLWERGRDLQPLIGPGDVPLELDYTRNAFFTQVGQREAYSSVLDADIAGANARAKAVDAAIASDSPALQRYRVGTRLATTIMLYSFGAREGEERGLPEPDLLQAAVVPGLDRLSMTTALNDLRQQLLYVHYTGRRYRFETQYNLNKLIDEECKNITTDDVEGRVRETLAQALKGARGAVCWPDNHSQVSDRIPVLQIIYLSRRWAGADPGEIEKYLTEWLEYCGNSRREYKNGLAFALPGYLASDNVFGAARESLAIDNMLRDKRRFNFNPDQLAELKERGNIVINRLSRAILNLYEKAAVPVPERSDEAPYTWRYVELQSRSEPSLHARLVGALMDSRLVFDSLTPDKLVSLTHLSEYGVLETGEVVKQFYTIFGFTRLTSTDALFDTISRGVRDGKFGYTALVESDDNQQPRFPNPDLVYYNRQLRGDEIDLEGAYLIDASIAVAVTQKTGETLIPGGVGSTVTTVPGVPGAGPDVGVSPKPVQPEGQNLYQLIARATKSNFFKMVKALQNLSEASDSLDVQIQISASSRQGYDPVWLRNAVEEPMDEADVEVVNKSLE